MSEIILRRDMPQYVHENALGIKVASINLLSNAVKYTNKGFVILTLTGEIRDGNVTPESEHS